MKRTIVCVFPQLQCFFLGCLKTSHACLHAPPPSVFDALIGIVAQDSYVTSVASCLTLLNTHMLMQHTPLPSQHISSCFSVLFKRKPLATLLGSLLMNVGIFRLWDCVRILWFSVTPLQNFDIFPILKNFKSWPYDSQQWLKIASFTLH